MLAVESALRRSDLPHAALSRAHEYQSYLHTRTMPGLGSVATPGSVHQPGRCREENGVGTMSLVPWYLWYWLPSRKLAFNFGSAFVFQVHSRTEASNSQLCRWSYVSRRDRLSPGRNKMNAIHCCTHTNVLCIFQVMSVRVVKVYICVFSCLQ